MPSFDAHYEGRLLELLMQTLEHSPEDPKTFLEQREAEPAMVEDVLEMLREEPGLDDFLETPALCRLQDLLPLPGLTVGVEHPTPPPPSRRS
jgi:hypothetical protein